MAYKDSLSIEALGEAMRPDGGNFCLSDEEEAGEVIQDFFRLIDWPANEIQVA